MMKKRSFLLVALVLFTVSLFAAPVVVTWEWMLEDPNVTTFRYQVDGEEPDQWIVVDSSVTSYTVKGLDGSQAYTLYLQQSYDGENFSGSATAASEPIAPSTPDLAVAEQMPVVDEVVAPEEEMAVAEEPAEPIAEEVVVAEEVVEEEPVVEEVAPTAVAATPVAPEKAKAEGRYKTTITIGGGISHMYDPISSTTFNANNAAIGLGVQFKNIMTFNNTFGLGLDLGLAYTPYLDGSYSWEDLPGDLFGGNFSTFWDGLTQTGTVSLAPVLNMQLGKVGFDLGGGAFVTYGPEFKSPKNPTYSYIYGAFAKLGLSYQFNSRFSMGLDAKYNFVLVDFNSIRKFAEAGLYMGFSF